MPAKKKQNYSGENGAGHPKDRCQTPDYAVDPLAPFLRRYDNPIIWEPAAGEGYLVRALKEQVSGCEIVAGDITTGEDFFSYVPPKWTTLVFNPPFSTKYLWLERAYELGRPFAMLCPVETVGAESAQKLFRKISPEFIWFDKRINYKMPNAGWNSSALFPSMWITVGLNIGRENTWAQINYRPQPEAVDQPYPKPEYEQISFLMEA